MYTVSKIGAKNVKFLCESLEKFRRLVKVPKLLNFLVYILFIMLLKACAY